MKRKTLAVKLAKVLEYGHIEQISSSDTSLKGLDPLRPIYRFRTREVYDGLIEDVIQQPRSLSSFISMLYDVILWEVEA